MTINLDTIELAKGAHSSPESGGCVMEWVSYLAHEPWSDHPECVSPVIGAFLRQWNDDLDNTGRQALKRYVPLVIGTATGPVDEERRAWMATDWMVRVYLLTWLRFGGMADQADLVAALPELVDRNAWTVGEPVVVAARVAAGDAAGDAAGVAAGVAAWDAAGVAAWDAAGDAAGDAAWDAAWVAAGDAAWAAARDAAWDAARVAAWDAARVAAWDAARVAAWDAARDALQPVVEELQASAHNLLEALIAVGREAA